MAGEVRLDSTATLSAVAQPPAQAAAATQSAATVTPKSATSPQLPNPRLTIDAGLNRVVLEFFDSSGVLTNSIPSQKQLQAYRLAEISGDSANPNGAAAT